MQVQTIQTQPSITMQHFGSERVSISIGLISGGRIALELVSTSNDWFAERISCTQNCVQTREFLMDSTGFLYSEQWVNALPLRLEEIVQFIESWRSTRLG